MVYLRFLHTVYYVTPYILIDLTERTFSRKNALYLACNKERAFFFSSSVQNYKLWSCQKVCAALLYLLDNIFTRFGTKFCKQIVCVPIGNICANGTVSTKMYGKRDDFDLVNFPFLDGDVPRRTSYGVYTSQLIRLARESSDVS